jgi:SAM-dependent methyltransferase
MVRSGWTISVPTERSSDALRAALFRLGLLGLARRGRDLLRTLKAVPANRPYLTNGAPDGLPIPPASLRILVAATPDIAWFLDSGHRGAESIREALARNGIALEAATPLLDFGCGCGRVVRHFADLGGGEGLSTVCGTDFNPALVEWCRRNLSFGRFETNDLEPPLPFEQGRFGLVYALSVFTHLPESLQSAWMEEVRRVLRPGGHLLFTTHGTRYAAHLTPGEQQRFNGGAMVVRRDDRPGSNVCGAYHPEIYVRERLARGFSVVDFVPQGATGNPWQDLWLLRKDLSG